MQAAKSLSSTPKLTSFAQFNNDMAVIKAEVSFKIFLIEHNMQLAAADHAGTVEISLLMLQMYDYFPFFASEVYPLRVFPEASKTPRSQELPGASPPGPPPGLCPWTPPGALRQAPGPHR